MPDGPNIEAYKRYLETAGFAPLTVIDGGQPGTADDYMQVNYAAFVGLDAQQTRSLVDTFARVAGDRVTIDEPEPGGPTHYTQERTREKFAQAVSEAQSGIQQELYSGGGREKNGIVYMDTRTASLNEHVKILDPQLELVNPAQERLYDLFMREHESAHQFLDLNESGADYVAAARLLQTNPGPETEQFLQTICDLRTLAPYRAYDQASAGERIIQYGAGSTAGIETLLNTPREDIARMTPEQMYEESQSFARINGREGFVRAEGRTMRPEMRVWEALREVNPEITGDRFAEANLAGTSQRLLDSDRFQHGSREEMILEQVRDAATRMDMAVTSSVPAAAPRPAPAPSVSPQM